MIIRKLPVDPGPAGWAAILSDAPGFAALDGVRDADVCVIGAGFAGLTAARRLSQLRPEARIIVLEARRVAEGPAGRNSGFMIDLPHDLNSENYGGALDADRAQTSDNRRAITFALDLAQALGLPDEAAVASGKVNAAATAKGMRHNEDYARHLTAMDEPFEMMGAAEMQAMTGTDYYLGGLYTPGAVILQPAMYIRGVAQGIQSNRVTICENSAVTGLSREGEAWQIDTAAGRVRAPQVILAVNGHLQSFGHMAGRLMHVHTYASMTRPLSDDECARLGGAATWGVTPADPLGTTVRRISGQGGHRIVIRNTFTFDPAMQPDSGWQDRIARDHDRGFRARFPMLGRVEMQYRWGGRLCLSLNNVQVIGEVEPGLIAACCQNGLGTAKGTLAGLLAAELACGVQSAALKRALDAPAPRRLPPAPIARLGGRARLRWGEWRAGAEF